MTRSSQLVYGGWVAIYLLVISAILILFDGTGDAGDSVLHFLMAQYAPSHPELFFDHWGKPMNTLLAALPAQWGFKAVQALNGVYVLIAALLTMRAAELAGFKGYVFIPAFFLTCSNFLPLTLSGLTEPLFALGVAMALFFYQKKDWNTLAITVSFLPFVRSEGLIVLGVVGFFLLLQQRYKSIVWLLTGHVFFALVGWAFGKELMWVVADNPYAHLESDYGSGSVFHFFTQMPYMIGIPNTIFLVGGIVALLAYRWSSVYTFSFAIFAAFFTAHTAFWSLGIFCSAGLTRVFLGVFPCIVLLMGGLFHFIMDQNFNRGLQASALAVVIGLVMFVTESPTRLKKKDLELSTDQRLMHNAAQYIEKQYPDRRLLYNAPYLSVVTETDYFDADESLRLSAHHQQWATPGDIAIWDNYATQVDYHFSFNDAIESGYIVEQLFVEGSDSIVIFSLPAEAQ
jgi:hypothetical protein